MRRILCLETEWGINNKSRRLVDKASVRPLFEFLESYAGLNTSVAYRTVATREELRYYLSQMAKKSNEDFDIVYLAFHGERGKILLHEAKDVNTVEDLVSLDDLSEMCDDGAEGWLSGKCVIFGSCSTLGGSSKKIEAFMRKSGARFVAGYAKSVEFAKSSILDLALITELLQSDNLTTVMVRMKRRYGGLMEDLKMRVYPEL